MSVKLTGSIEEIVQKIDATTDEAIRALLSEAIDYLIINSPLDTGAYLESHTISNTAGAPRSQKSSKRKRGTGGSANIDKARAQLEGDVLKLNVGGEVFNIRNNSPHANIVEHNIGGRIKNGKDGVYKKLAHHLNAFGLETKLTGKTNG
mgnify:FL=1|jgi:hypothetical protein|tara:strand:- start:586 stop:1032 length:447 start_codon:yes stop_codon:yes gene_type:complete